MSPRLETNFVRTVVTCSITYAVMMTNCTVCEGQLISVSANVGLRLDFTLVQLCRCKSAGTDLISKMVKTGTCRVVGLPQVCRSSATLQGSCTDSSRCNSAVQVCSLLFVYTVPEVTNSSNTLVYTVPWYPGTGTKVQFQGTVPVPWYKKGNNYA